MPSNPRQNLLLLLLAPVVLLPAVLWADEADDQYAVAAGHYARQRWKLAAEEFHVFLSKYPDHQKANQSVFFLAEALVQMGHVEEAGKYFRDYLQRESKGQFARPAEFRAAEADYLTGKLERAKVGLQKYRKEYPEDKLNTYVLPYLGDIALNEDDTKAAEVYFREGLGQFPKGRLQDDCRYGLARALEKQGKNEEAGRLYLAVSAKTSSSLADDAQFRLGGLQYTMGKYAEAIKTFNAFETRLSTSSWRNSARLGLGWALMKLNRAKEAKPWFQSIASDPKVGIEARYWLGLAEAAEKDWSAAAKTLLAVAAEAPKHRLLPAIQYHAGDALLRMGDLAGACKQFDQVIASSLTENQWIDDALRGKVQAAWKAKDYKELDRQVAEFTKRFPTSPLKPDVQRLSARSLLERKQYEQAVKVLEPLTATEGQGEERLEDRYLLSLAYEGVTRFDDALAVLLPVLDSATGPLKIDAQLTQASLFVATKRFGEAVKPLEAVLATEPTGDADVKCKGQLAICYARTKRLDEAKKWYTVLLEKYPEHKLIQPTTEQVAEAAYAVEDFRWAAELFGWMGAEGQPEDYRVRGLSGLGWSQFKSGKLAEAAKTFEQLLGRNPDAKLAAEAGLVRGGILEQLKQPDAALAMYDLVIDRYPKSQQHPNALLAAARLRDELQQDREAAELYEQLSKEYPKLPELDTVLYEWSWVLYDLGKAKESNALLKRLRTEFPKSAYWPEATYRLAQRVFDAKDYARAAELVAEVLSSKPAPEIREHTLFLKGQIAVAEKKWTEVEAPFATLIKDYPESPLRLVAEYWIADATYRQDDYETAGKLFDSLARETHGRDDPWLAMVALRRAQVLAQKKKWNEAYAMASKIAEEYLEFEQQYEADYLIGRCLANRADFEGARKAYHKVIQSPQGGKTETAAMAQWMIGETYFHQKNYETALREYLRLEVLYAYPTWQAAALLQAGKCHELLGEWKEATELYTRLLKVYPKGSFAEEASRRLRTAKERAADKPASRNHGLTGRSDK